MRWMGRIVCPPSQASLPASGCSLWVDPGRHSVEVGICKEALALMIVQAHLHGMRLSW